MTKYSPHHSVFVYEGKPLTHVIVDTDIWDSYDAFRGMSVGEILVHLTEFLTWLKGYEPEPIDPNKIRHTGKNVMTRTVSFSYHRPATDEEVAEDERQKEERRIKRVKNLREQLKELES